MFLRHSCFACIRARRKAALTKHLWRSAVNPFSFLEGMDE